MQLETPERGGPGGFEALPKARVRGTEWPVNWRYGNTLGGPLGALSEGPSEGPRTTEGFTLRDESKGENAELRSRPSAVAAPVAVPGVWVRWVKGFEEKLF